MAEHKTWGRGSTRASRTLRARVLAEHPVCYLNYDGCTTVATEDDHIVPLSQGGSDHLSNHAGACHPCHRVKSQREAAQAHAHISEKRPQEQHPGLA